MEGRQGGKFPGWLEAKGLAVVGAKQCSEMLDNFEVEYNSIDWSEEEINELTNSKLSHRYFLEGGWRRSYASAYYGSMIARSIRHLFPNGAEGKRVMEIGCGTGTQTILYSAIGALATGIDIDHTRLSIAEKRLLFYQTLIADRPLPVNFLCEDVLRFQPKEGELFDAVYSMFALNLIQPTAEVLIRVREWMAPKGRLVIDDGNYGYFLIRILRRKSRVLLPNQITMELRRAGFRVLKIQYGGIVPPCLWIFPRFARLMCESEQGFPLRKHLARAYWVVAERN